MSDAEGKKQVNDVGGRAEKKYSEENSYIFFIVIRIVFRSFALLAIHIFKALMINLGLLKYVFGKLRQGFFVVLKKVGESEGYKNLIREIKKTFRQIPGAISLYFKTTVAIIAQTSVFTFRIVKKTLQVIKITSVMLSKYIKKLSSKKKVGAGSVATSPAPQVMQEEEKMALPLYFGWEVVVRKAEKVKRKMKGPFKKYWQYATVVTILIVFVSTTLFFNASRRAGAATYYWTQASWSGGASATTAIHTDDQSTWNKYVSKDSIISAGSTVTLSSAGGPWTETSSTDFSAGALSDAVITGTGDAASIKLASSLGFSETTLDSISGAFFVSAADVDEDGDDDILGAAFGADDVILYRNDGGGTFTEIFVDNNVNAPVSARAADVNGDGDIDVVVAAEFAGDILWYENDGSESFTKRTVDLSLSSPSSAFAADLDGDTDVDIVATSLHGDLLVWYENNGSESFTKHTIDSPDGPKDIAAKDIDKDGDMDLAVVMKYARQVTWYENNGSESFTKHILHSNFDGAWSVSINDIDQNGEWDILSASQYSDDITWWGNDGSENFTENTIDGNFDGALGSYSDDIDGDGDIDVMGGSSMGQNEVIWWENDGSENWTAHVIDSDLTEGNSVASGDFDGDGDVDVVAAGRTANVIALYTNDTLYETSGNFTSASQDLGSAKDFTTLDFSSSVPANTTLQIQIATNTNNSTWNFVGPDGTSGTYYTSSGAAIHSSHDDDRYIKYKAFFTTTDTAASPVLESISVNYSVFQTLISSAYDAISDANVVAGFKWDEDTTLPAGATLTFFARSAANSTALASASWNEIASSTSAFLTSGCTKASQTVTCTDAVIPAGMKDETGDQWLQYKVDINSTSTTAPTIDNITMVYVVNAPPEFEALPTASQDANGLVNISYSVRDPDTDTGVTQNTVLPSFEYSLDNGNNWNNVTTGLSANATSTKTVAQVSYNSYNLTWDAKTQINGQYSTTAKIRVTANDSEAANNTGSSISAAFTLDTKDPVGGSFVVDSRSGVTNTLTLSATDDDITGMKMKISNNSDLSADGVNAESGDWINYNTTKSWVLAGNPETIYYQFQDQYGNISNNGGISSMVLPGETANVLFQDVSNPETSEWREFIAWGSVDVPVNGFKRYNVYRSTDGTNYSLLATQSDREINYILDANLNSSNTYYYKVAAEDNIGNISNYSSVISDVPNGQGGSDLTSPTISNVVSSGITTQSAVITWDTGEASNSTVEYITVTGGDFTSAPSQGVATMADTAAGLGQHSVTMTGLTPNTTYYYQVKSADALDNSGTSKDGADGYTFTTLNGPTISNVSASDIDNNQATITWSTNVNSDSYVVYSANPDMSSSGQVGIANSVTAHSITVTGLTTGLKYYYYVKSGVAEDKNVVGNEIQYYNFTTTADAIAPVITFTAGADITSITDTSALISWTTDEYATSTLEYGVTDSYGDTLSNNSYNTSHAYPVTGLTKGTTYHIRLKSTDANGNTATVDSVTFDTTDSSDYTAPTITFTPASDITINDNSAVVVWTTNEAATSTLEYGLTDSYGTTLTNNSLNTDHSFNMSSLTKDTQYYIRLLSTDGSGNTSTAATTTFTTTDSTDYTAPVITFSAGSDITNLTDTSVDIAWTTNEAATSTLEYGTTESYGTTVSNNNYNFNHDFALTSLTLGTQYYVRLKSADAAGNVSVAATSTFTTTDSTDSTAPVITFNSGTDITDIADTTATVSWTTNESATSTLEYGLTDSYGSVMANNNLNTNHSFDMSSLTKGTLYYIRLKSTDNNGNTSTAATATFTTTDTTDYTAPVITFTPASDITNVTDNTAMISWTTNENATSTLEYGVTDSYGTTLANNNFNANHSFSLSSLAKGTTYYIRLKNADASGNVSVAATSTFTTTDTADETAPIITFTAGNDITIADTTATVSWTTNEAATSTLEYGLTDSYGTTLSNDNLNTNHSHSVTGLTKNTLYYIRLINTDNNGNTSTATTATFTTTDSTDYVAPTITFSSGSDITSITDTSVDIAWTTNEAATSTLEYGTSESYGTTVSNDNYNYNHSFSLSSLTKGTQYYIRLKSADSAGNVSTAATSTFTTTDSTDYTAPTITFVAGTDITNIADTTATVSWATNEAATSTLEYGLTTSYGSTLSNNNLNTNHSFDLSGLTKGTQYYIRLLSTDSNGNTSVATTADFTTTDSTDYTAPTITFTPASDITNITDNTAMISWTTNENATSTLEYGVTDSYGTTLANNNYNSDHSFSLSSLAKGTTYYIRLKNADASGNVSVAATSTFTTTDSTDYTAPVITFDSGTDIIDIADTTATVTWTTNESATSTLEYGLTDSYGSTLSNNNFNTNHSFDMSGLTKGTLYYIRLLSTDSNGNTSIASTATFTTTDTTDYTSPVITFSAGSDITNLTDTSVDIAWTTDEAATSTLEYGTSESYGTTVSNDNYNYNHSFSLSSLTLGTQYFIRLKSADASGNVSVAATSTFTTTDSTDSTAPVITFNSVSDITNIADTTATVSWTTNESATSTLEYGTTDSYGSTLSNNNLNTNHSFDIGSLAKGTTYYIRLKSADNNGNTSIAATATFITTDSTDYVAPTITFTTGTDITSVTDNTAIISWTTNELATSTLEYGLTDSYGTTLANNNYNSNHSFSLSSLAKGTLYYIRLKGTDSSGNTSTAVTATFTTTDTADETAPVITFNSGNDITDITNTSAIVSWSTDEVATSTLEYGLTDSYGTTLSNDNFNTNHSHLLTSLTKGSTYYIRLISTDNNGNTSTATTATFDTTDTTDYDAPIITFNPVNNITNITDTAADITWTTNEAATSTFEYGLTDSYGTVVANNNYNYNHAIALTSLTKGTTYYIRLTNADATGNISTAATSTFTTTDSTDYTAPVITFSSGSDITNITDTTATVSWATNEAATSTLEYGTTDSYGTTASNDNLNTNHSFDLSALAKGTAYHIRLKSADANGNISTAATSTFTTSDTTDYTAPAISSISASPVYDTVAVINWTTDESTTSLLQYGTSAGVYTSFVADNNSNTTHTISITDLATTTTYYYSITSTDATSNAATSAEFNFTTLETLSQESDVVAREDAAAANSGGGGGVIIIDKTDKTAPKISSIRVSEVTSNSAKVSWVTNEETDSQVKFGLTTNYGRGSGGRSMSNSHSVVLNYLSPGSLYNYKISSADADGNIGESNNLTFSTLSVDGSVEDTSSSNGDTTEEEEEEEEEEVVEEEEEEEVEGEVEGEVVNEEQDAKNLLEMATQAAQKAMGIIKNSASKLSLGFIESSLTTQQNSIEELAYLLPMPVMSGDPTVVVTDRTATISWHTDREASSLVAIAPDGKYNNSLDNPYLQVVGNPSDRSVEHKVVIHDLEPNSEYHYQLRNKPLVGTEARSKDFIFQTEQEVLGIQSYVIQNISNEEAIFKWVTNSETNSTVKYTPYRNGTPDYELTRSKADDAMTTIHEVEITDLEAGLVYEVELVSTDITNNIIKEIINSFSTSDNDVAPEIGQVQTTSAISPGKTLRIQTVISWLTNEPSTTKVYYQKGVAKSGEQLREETKIDENYTKKHVVVITKFDPGSVYSFQTESIDASGNVSLSKIYTILTPRQEESVFQVIVKNLEGVFGWVKQMK